jgi:hypothetical protein
LSGGDDPRIQTLLRRGRRRGGVARRGAALLELNAGTLRYLAARLARRGVLTGDEVERVVRCGRAL